mmetsp:Transcript_2804/g.3728  ORF Transcript_2804/g.3728 Transcript_2804/m.3728 type:complete len:295 (-) Transcript_2804:52-936(-)
MPRLIGSSKTVVEHDGLTINELAGNVATSEDTISIAHVTVANPSAEPWLTLDYDEWLCVTKGKIILHYKKEGADLTLEVNAGETAFVAKGERFRPFFPVGDTEYIPICIPAFRPDRCQREEGDVPSDVSQNLRKLHGMDENANAQSYAVTSTDDTDRDVLYHMCQKSLWESAVAAGTAYFPPTFDVDGGFTHATAVPRRLIDTANHFYTQTEGEWICLQLSRSALATIGIKTKDEEALPVGQKSVSDDWNEMKWVCPHIYGGLSTKPELNVLTKVYEMVRDDDGKFLSIKGLVD